MKKILKYYFSIYILLGLISCNPDQNLHGYVMINAKGNSHSLLIPGQVNDIWAARVITLLFSGLVYYDEYGKVKLDMAQSITTKDNQTYIIKLKNNIKFTDGSEVKTHNFIDAWNLSIKEKNREINYLSYIQGYDESIKADFVNLSGVKKIDDKTFTIKLKRPVIDFEKQLGQAIFFPLPDITLKGNLQEFSKNPIGNGPYKLLFYTPDIEIVLTKNDGYNGTRIAQNKGIKFIFYPKMSATYASFLSGQLDVLDGITDENIANIKQDLNQRVIIKPIAKLYSIEVNTNIKHFKNDEEGRLRKHSISMAINRKEIADIIFKGINIPAIEFTSPVFSGYNPQISASQVLKFNPQLAKKLWDKADKISKFNGVFTLSYVASNDDKAWVDAVCNQLKNNLKIQAQGLSYPDAKSLFEDQYKRKIKLAVVRTWTGDYPSQLNFLEPVFSTTAIGYTNGTGTNTSNYSNTKFDELIFNASTALNEQESHTLINTAQEILLHDLPAIPLWYINSFIGFSNNVTNVKVDWIGKPIYYLIKKD